MIVTRFAPSPTGFLHIGGLRTALFNWLWARKNGGKFLLRIEDTDLARNSHEATEAIIKAFDWVGLNYDGDVIYQSERFDLYKAYANKLLEEGKAYKCYMSQAELEELRSWQMANKQKPGYDRRYRDGTLLPKDDTAPVIRIKAPLDGSISFDDGVKGNIKVNASELDDFIILRADGTPTYNFVVAIDDALMGVNTVIRGDDHTSNTPKQLMVYEALGFEKPKFFHVPMILGSDGKKLSKRDGAADVMDYKALGYAPEALLNFLARLGWSHKDKELFSTEELLELFNPSDINKSASQYNIEKLNWINSSYLKNLAQDKLIDLLCEFGCNIKTHPQKASLVNIGLERVKTLSELARTINSIIMVPEIYDEVAIAKHIDQSSPEILQAFANMLTNEATPEQFQSLIETFLRQKDLKMPKLGLPLRLALIGSTTSPAIGELLSVIGVQEIKHRIALFIKR
jgi:glutamyl-tRNA synthetase